MPAVPPLAWLRAFEAAARLHSFKEAAAELSVSPSTISHQVRDLEGAIGVPLFSRQGNRLRLTEEGERLHQPLTQGFDLIRNATSHVTPSTSLRIGAFPFLGSEVILPTVPEIKRTLGVTNVEVQTSTDLSRLVRVAAEQRLDAIIKYGPPPSNEVAFPGFLSIPLFPIKLVPIIGADLATPDSIAELLALPQIRLIGPFDAWGGWAKAFRVDAENRSYVLETDNYHAAVLAVERGEGFCLGVFPFLASWQARQRIIALDKFACDIPQYAHLVFAHHNQDSERLHAFADWLVNHLK